MAWLFTKVAGQESNATIPRLALYILYFSIHKKTIFDWAKIISSELSFKLLNFRKNKKFICPHIWSFLSHIFMFLKGCIYQNISIAKLTLLRHGTLPYGNERQCIFFTKCIIHLSLLLRSLYLGQALQDCLYKCKHF